MTSKKIFVPYNKPIKKSNIFSGAFSRSRTGCLHCKQRRKRCDEVHPTCGLCTRRGITCGWNKDDIPNPPLRSDSKLLKNQMRTTAPAAAAAATTAATGAAAESIQENAPVTSSHLDISLPTSPSAALTLMTPSQTTANSYASSYTSGDGVTITSTATALYSPANLAGLPFAGAFPDFDTWSLSPTVHAMMETFDHIMPQLPDLGIPFDEEEGPTGEGSSTASGQLVPSAQSTHPNPFFLDEDGHDNIRFFQQYVANTLCINSGGSPNHLIDTFLGLAEHNEAITYALAAWGGYLQVGKEGRNNAMVASYLVRAKVLMEDRYRKDAPFDKYDRYVLLCFYMIEMGIEIFKGDVSDWYTVFKKCHSVLTDKYGGIEQIGKDFEYSNQVRWLVSNLQFHDIMSSKTQTTGTLFPMDDYRNFFNKYNEDDKGYGLDPFQGILQPINLVLGDIMNAHKNLKNRRRGIEQQQTDESSSPPSASSVKYFRELRSSFYNAAESTFDEFKKNIDECEPCPKQIAILSNAGKKILGHHLTLFELAKNTCHLYMLLHIKRVAPSSSEVQQRLLSSISYIESLADTVFVAALPMSLLICGISSCLPCDRKQISDIYKKISDVYKVGNVENVWKVVQEYWKRNPEGDLCLDWAEICEENEWCLSMC